MNRNQLCDCGKPGTIRRFGQWICGKCAGIDGKPEGGQTRRQTKSGKKEIRDGFGLRRSYNYKNWENYDRPIAVGGSLQALEQKLAEIDNAKDK